MSSGVTDENGNIIDHGDDEAPPPEPGQRGSFWDWVFGRDERRPPPPPPAVPQNYGPPPQERYAPQSYDRYQQAPPPPDYRRSYPDE